MVEFYLLTFPRFPLRKKEHKSYFGKNRTHDFRTSRCAAYLLDHSGDDYTDMPVVVKDVPSKVVPLYIRYLGTVDHLGSAFEREIVCSKLGDSLPMGPWACLTSLEGLTATRLPFACCPLALPEI